MARRTPSERNIKCSFCGKTQDMVKRIVAGPGVYICDECISLCKNIIEEDYVVEEETGYTIDRLTKLPKPEEIKNKLADFKNSLKEAVSQKDEKLQQLGYEAYLANMK